MAKEYIHRQAFCVLPGFCLWTFEIIEMITTLSIIFRVSSAELNVSEHLGFLLLPQKFPSTFYRL
jgi:hypothetical protein